MFLFENEFVTAYDSFLTQTPSEYQIETLTETILWQISHKDLQEVYKKTTIGNIIGRKMAENMYLRKSKRELSLLSQTAEERYLSLFSDRPKLCTNDVILSFTVPKILRGGKGPVPLNPDSWYVHTL